MAFLLERDALNGKSGSAVMTVDGENHELFQMKKFNSDASFRRVILRLSELHWFRKRLLV